MVSGGMGCRRPGLPRLPPGDLLCRAAPTGRPVSTKSRAPWASSDRAQGAGAAFFHGKLPGMFLCNACPELLADPCFPFPPLLLPPPLHEAPRAGRPWGPGEAGVFPAATSGGPPSPCAPRHREPRRPATLLGPPPRPSPQNPEPGLQGQARSKHPAGPCAGEGHPPKPGAWPCRRLCTGPRDSLGSTLGELEVGDRAGQPHVQTAPWDWCLGRKWPRPPGSLWASGASRPARTPQPLSRGALRMPLLWRGGDEGFWGAPSSAQAGAGAWA